MKLKLTNYKEDTEVLHHMNTVVPRQKKSEWLRKLTRKQMEREKKKIKT